MLFPLIFGKLTLASLIIEFSLAGLLVIIFGTLVTKYGDIIAESTGLGGTWIGITLLATITSIPEITASVSSVTIFKEPSLGIGNLYGSCAFNLVILVILDLIQGSGSFTSEVKLSHILPAAQGIFLMCLGVIGIIACMVMPAHSRVISGLVAFTIFVAFLVGTRLVYRVEMSEIADGMEEDLSERSEKIKHLYLKFALSAIMIALAGCWLSTVGEKLAKYPIKVGDETLIFGASFVGTIFVAIMTSMPEVVVSVSALRIGAIDMAVANVLGSNLFDTTIIFFMQLFYWGNGVFTNADKTLLIPAIIAIIETSILITGLIYRSRKSFLLMGFDNIVLLCFYLVGNWLFFKATVQRI